MDRLREMLEEPGEYQIITRELEASPPGRSWGGLRFWPLPASHPGEGAFLYLLAGGGKRIFIAYDTGWFLEPVWEGGWRRSRAAVGLCGHGVYGRAGVRGGEEAYGLYRRS